MIMMYETIPNPDVEADKSTAAEPTEHRNSWTVFASISVFLIIAIVATAFSAGSATQTKWIVLLVSGLALLTSLWNMAIPSQIPETPYDSQRKTWFGHRMSLEGEWKHIPVVLIATYAFVFTYGAVVSLMNPETHILTIPIFYVVGLVVFYLWHLGAHVLKGTELNRVHMIHHREEYPEEDFYGDHCPHLQDDLRARGGRPQTLIELMNPLGRGMTKTFAHEGPIFVGILCVLLVAKFVFGVSTVACGFVAAGYTFMALFGNAIHMSFHERNFQWESYAWYRELRALHMLHHMQRKNYAMVNILLDLVFGSLLISE